MNTESKQIWIGRPHLVLGKDVARAVADVGLNGHKELWFEVPADRKDELEAKARLGSRNQHYMEAVKAMDEKGIHASESVRRKMRGGAAAEAVIKANREKLLEKAKETGLL
jgi:predicted RNA-binding Zn ribbon-like protein